MDPTIEEALRRIVACNRDIFGENSVFIHFEFDGNFLSSNGLKSSLLFGRIVYRNGKTCFSPPMVLKCAGRHEFFPCFVTYFEFINEVFFYTKLLPFFSTFRSIGHLFPKYYSSGLSASVSDFNGVILLENVQATAEMTVAKQPLFLDYDHLVLMMRKLGEFHAYSYRARQVHPNCFVSLATSLTETHMILHWDWRCDLPARGQRALQKLREQTEYASKVAELEECNAYAEDLFIKVLCGDQKNLIAVLCHGDYLKSNVLFRYKNEKAVDLKIVDMATCKLASPVVDLAQVLYLNADQQMRDKHWDDFIEEYYTALKETFPDNEIPAKNAIVGEFRGKVWLAYFVASYFLPGLIAMNNNLPTFNLLVPEKYRDVSYYDIPQALRLQAISKVGGEQATEVLTSILKDMIDRGFL